MSRKSTAVARWDEPKLLAGDAERDEAFKRITNAHVEGRLSAGMMNDMLDRAQKAVRVSNLIAICDDLPELPEPRESTLSIALSYLWNLGYGMIPAGLFVMFGGAILAFNTAPRQVLVPGGNDGFGDYIAPVYGGIHVTGATWVEVVASVVIGLWLVVAGVMFLNDED